jgi:predicted HAD superfamily Cof-like phosphohydrolase
VKNLTAEFIDVFDASRDPQLWLKLIDEEIKEAQEAMAHVLKEMADVKYVYDGLISLVGDSWDAQILMGADRCAAIHRLEQLFHLGSYKAAVRKAHKRVHESNMSKLGDDGKPIRREDGKIMKGSNYKEPDLMDLVTPL